jgi:hypothetical protein
MKFSLIPSIIAMAVMNGYMQEAEAEKSTGGDAGTAEKKKRAPKTNLLNIVRGRMPLACVAAIRFHVKPEVSNADVAKIFGTSVGKVFDIRKGRNFGYIGEDYKPSEADLVEAAKWAKAAADHGGDEAAVMAAVDKLGKATPDEAKAQAEKITAQRSKGPRQPKAKAEGETGAGTTGKSAADLLQ